MAKPEWGTKRTCQNCGARFYDLNRPQIVCPACGTPFDLESAGKVRRTRTVAARAVAEEEESPAETEEDEPLAEAEEDEDLEAEKDEEVVEEEEEEEDQALIEDASELGDDDVSDVIESDVDGDAEERG